MKTSAGNRREKERHKERPQDIKEEGGKRENVTSLFLWRTKELFRGK